MDVLLEFSDELVLQNLNVCGSEFRQKHLWQSLMYSFNWSQSAFLYSKMSRGTCLFIFGLTFTSARTMSWSERPGRTVVLSIRVGFEVSF